MGDTWIQLASLAALQEHSRSETIGTSRRAPVAGADAGVVSAATQRTESGPVSSVTVVAPQPAMSTASTVELTKLRAIRLSRFTTPARVHSRGHSPAARQLALVAAQTRCYDETSPPADIKMGKTLLQKVWELHTVRQLPTGQTQLFIGLHLVHEVTSPQAFDTLRARGWKVARPDRTFATVDHIVPTRERQRPFLDVLAEDMIASLERNCRDFGVRLAGLEDDRQGIVHVIGPELGLTQPGMTIACGDSHTSTHGAFGAVAFGIGTSQVRDVLASQCLALEPLKVRRIRVTGQMPAGVYAKDVVLTIIQRLGVRGGVGYAYEYAGDTIERMSMEERMTICNMSIEGGARVGYVNPDETTFEYLSGRPFAPAGEDFDRATTWWRSIASDADAVYDDEVTIRAEELEPVVTWGVNPEQSIGIHGHVPSVTDAGVDPKAIGDALSYMGLAPGQAIEGTKVDVAFIGSCTNGRLSDLREAAKVRARPSRRGARQGAGRPGLGRRQPCRRTGGAGRHVPRRRLRMARRRLLDVSRHEPGSPRRQPGLRRLLEPQLQGAPGQPDRPHAVDEPGDGCRCRCGRRGHRCPDAGELMVRITEIAGRGVPVPGEDIDTDRIMPARFLRAVTFDGLETHVFEDDRKTSAHPFDDPRFQGASVLLVNRNFGCGSSREHAPQGLQRWGIKAVIGESFAEIFFGNAGMIGMPCLVASAADIRALMEHVAQHPAAELHIDIVKGTCEADGFRCAVTLPPNVRDAFVTGAWDTTGILLDRFDEVHATAARLPYVSGFSSLPGSPRPR